MMKIEQYIWFLPVSMGWDGCLCGWVKVLWDAGSVAYGIVLYCMVL